MSADNLTQPAASALPIKGVAAFLPRAPHYALDWPGLDAAFPWIQAMKGSPHDPVHHQEGDPWVHTRMVVQALVDDPDWRQLDEPEALIAFVAAVMHDIGKPATALVEEATGRVTNRGHSRIGAIMTRRILWEQGWSPVLREQVCALIERHQSPFWLYEKDHTEILRIVSGQSLLVKNRLLWLLARADARGRICNDQEMMLAAVDEFRALCESHGCFDRQFAFYGDHERFMFLSGRAAFDPTYQLGGGEAAPVVTIMSALPGAGKSTWIRRNNDDSPVISLDEIRREMGIAPDKPQGPVLEAARETARSYLRVRRDFIWDATNFTREMRGKTIDLCRQYGFRIRIVFVDTDRETLRRQNRDRPYPVPEAVVDRMLDKWEFPRPNEYHELVWVNSHG